MTVVHAQLTVFEEEVEMPPKKASRMWALETAKKILAGMEEVMVALTRFFLLPAYICTHHIYKESHIEGEKERDNDCGCEHTHLYTRPGVTNACPGSHPEHVHVCAGADPV